METKATPTVPAPVFPDLKYPDTQSPFRYWVQMALPAVYGDELSYYELLSKVVDALNTTLGNSNLLNNDVQELAHFVNQLSQWVQDYFKNLDVQKEIDSKLDKMAATGQLQEMVSNLFTVFGQRISKVESDMTDLEANAVMVSGTEQVRWQNLNQDVKDKLVSGTPPVAAPNSINASNIIDGAVKYSKLNSELTSSIIFDNATVFNATQVGGYWKQGTGNVPVLEPSNEWNRDIIDVDGVSLSPLDTVVFSAPNDGSVWGGVYCLFITNEAGNIIKIVSFAQAPAWNEPFSFTVPYDAAKIYFNMPVSRPYITFMRVSGFSYSDNRLSGALTALSEPLIADKIEEGIYTTSNWGTKLGSYRSYAYAVTPGEKLHLKGNLPASAQFTGGLFFAEMPSGIDSARVMLGAATPNYSTEYTHYDTDVIVPAGARWIVISNNTGAQEVQRYGIGESSGAQGNLIVERVGDVVTAVRGGFGLTLEKRGPNGLVMPSRFVIAGNALEFSTDTFPAPYIVLAQSNPTGDRTSTGFTGGNHGWDNSGSTVNNAATASMELLEVYVDGIMLQPGQKAIGKVLTVKTVNAVQASNTCLEAGGGRAVIREHVVFEFDGRKMSCSNTIEALEALYLDRYYGMQLAGFALADYDIYTHSRYIESPGGAVNEPGKNCPFAWVGENDLGCVTMKMEPVGVGTYEWATEPVVALASGNKAYYSPVYGRVSVESGYKFYVAGSYNLSVKRSL